MTHCKQKLHCKITLVLTILFLITTIPLASASTTITRVTAPASITEGETLEVSFEAETSDNSTIIYYIYKENVLVASQNSYEWATNYTAAGSYEFKFLANTTNSSAQETRTVVVNNDPLMITITSPEAKTYSENLLELVVESDQAENCNYDINNTETGSLANSGNQYAKTVQLAEGSYELKVNCSNTEESGSESVKFQLDLTPPKTSNAEPDNSYDDPLVGSSATLSVETDEQSICKYDASDEPYSDMDYSMTQVSDFRYVSEVKNLEEGKHLYYVRCRDEYGNEMQASETIVFYTNDKPSASISIDESKPLKAGTYEVTLTASESLQPDPTLQYSYHNTGGKKPVSLTGSGKSWTGYLIIDDKTSDTVGTFHFLGKDDSGMSGSEITSGKLFLIDTTEPPKVDSLEYEQEDNYVELRWHYEGEETEEFRIYRSITGSVSYNDLYEDTGDTTFEDMDVEDGVTYYYKVAAVDDAGNVGPLSNQLEAEVRFKEQTRTLSAGQKAKIDSRVIEVESEIMDADWALNNLERETDNDKNSVIEALGLVKKSQALKSNLEKSKSELEKLKNTYQTENALDKDIERIMADVERYSSQLIDSVEIQEQVEYQEVFDQPVFAVDLKSYLNLKNKESDSEDILTRNQQLQVSVTVYSTLTQTQISYLSGELEDYTLVEKSISLDEPLPNVNLVEFIPKSMAVSAQDIVFSESPRIVRDDPIVEWGLGQATSKKVTYYVDKLVPLSDSKKAKSYVFTTTLESETNTLVGEDNSSEEQNKVTGMASGTPSKGLDITILLSIFGVIIIGGLSYYYYFYLEDAEYAIPRETSSKNEVIVEKRLPEEDEAKDLFRLIERANSKADQFDFQDVQRLYSSAYHLYQASNLGSRRPIVGRAINNIYRKMIIVHFLNESKQHLVMEDNVSASKYLQKAKNLIDLESEEGVFHHRASNIYEQLFVALLSRGSIF